MKIPSCLLLILTLCCTISLGVCLIGGIPAPRIEPTPTTEPATTPTITPQPESLHPSDLLLSLDDLPDNWTVNMEPSQIDLGYGELATWGILYECQWLEVSTVQVALHAISEYETAPKARAAYRDHVDPRTGEGTQWDDLSSLYDSPYADDYLFACRQGASYICVTVARYQNYISFTEVDVDPGCIDLLELHDMLQAIDEDMATAINQ